MYLIFYIFVFIFKFLDSLFLHIIIAYYKSYIYVNQLIAREIIKTLIDQLDYTN